MTNYEAIKAMGMNELAGFLASITTCGDCPAGNCDGHEVCTAALLEWLTDEPGGQTFYISHVNAVISGLAEGGNEIDVDDEPGETSDMIHHPDHYIWKGTECKKSN
jgi:hypothetical protein